MSAHPRGRTAAATTLLAVAGVLVAGPASAHVTVGADDDHQGAADSVLTFRVPNEEDTATTVKVVVKFPVKDPIASVKPEPKPGWTVTTKPVTFNPPIVTDDGTLTTGVGEVTWTASSPAQGIPVGGFDSFTVLVGPLPQKADSLAFPTVQSYSDGKSVAWIEATPVGGTAPEHPAPVLTLTAATPGADATTEPAARPSASATAATAGQATPVPSVESSPSPAAAPALATEDFATKSEASTGRTLGILGLVLGALGLAAGGAALARSRRTGSRPHA